MTSRPLQSQTGGALPRIWLGVCATVAAALFLSQLLEIPVRSAFRGYDNTFNYLWLRSAMVDGDWDFRNDLEQCDTLVPEQKASALTLPRTKTNRTPNKYGVGWAVITTPFYLVADASIVVGRRLGVWSFDRDGFNPVYQVCIQTGHMALALLSLLLAWRVIAVWTGSDSAAFGGVLLLWAASPLLYYQTVNLSMSHGAVFLCIALYAWSLEKARRASGAILPWLLAGAALGLAVITRFQAAIFGVAALGVLWSEHRSSRRTVTSALLLITGALPLLALQLFAWHAVYGEWLVFSYGGEGEVFYWGDPELAHVLFSSWHGLFYWHPFLLVGVAGLMIWAWEARRDGAVWALTFMLSVYVSAAWWCWWFASSFGNRSFDAAILPLMAGAAWLLARGNARVRTFLWTVAIIAGVWNFYVVLLYRSGAISRFEAVSWVEMIQAAVRLRDAVRF